jgi:c-di-GMP-binding flagellar brake protein YcgR|tara:strand:+ start:1407 stop:1571 length:165 start_codon:yes stop_codon:yes gene_type:complete
MSRARLTFKNECLVVDWVSFKFQDLDSLAERRLAEYFFSLGFNSYRVCEIGRAN